jgi:hypothetical protein
LEDLKMQGSCRRKLGNAIAVPIAAMLILVTACQDGPQPTAPSVRGLADADATLELQPVSLVFGVETKRTFVLVGEELQHPDGRRIVVSAAIARQFRTLAIADKKVRERAAALEPRWRKLGLPSIAEAIETRRLGSNSARKARTPLAVTTIVDGQSEASTEQRRSSSMARTCEEIALDIYESTVDYHEDQDILETYTNALYNCLSHSADCTVAASNVFYWSLAVAWDQLVLEDLAYSYSAQGCWGPGQ